MLRIVIFASGSGTNTANVIDFFQKKKTAIVTYVLTNNKNAKVIERSKKRNVTCLIFKKDDLYQTNKIISFLKKEADYIVLAGFLLKIPKNIVKIFSNKIINIHPALLPKYGGKGMYGIHIHRAVINNNEKESGITIHFVNENYDEGLIIFQKQFEIGKNDVANDVAKKIAVLEMANFPQVIEEVVLKNLF
ncbi:MAG: phosphoribosylglycinamide formyltransferase [Flavobacteriaceae bacterium]|nr:phosphoribosylglycinamide formyltransferase [Flavobacteriaceae bacterium]